MIQDTDDYAEVTIRFPNFESVTQARIPLKDIPCPQKRKNEIRDHIEDLIFKELISLEIFVRDNLSKTETKINTIARIRFSLTNNMFIDDGLMEYLLKSHQKNIELAYEGKDNAE